MGVYKLYIRLMWVYIRCMTMTMTMLYLKSNIIGDELLFNFGAKFQR